MSKTTNRQTPYRAYAEWRKQQEAMAEESQLQAAMGPPAPQSGKTLVNRSPKRKLPALHEHLDALRKALQTPGSEARAQKLMRQVQVWWDIRPEHLQQLVRESEAYKATLPEANCDACGSTFKQRRPNHKHCVPACRKKKYEGSEAAKQRKAKYGSSRGGKEKQQEYERSQRGRLRAWVSRNRAEIERFGVERDLTFERATVELLKRRKFSARRPKWMGEMTFEYLDGLAKQLTCEKCPKTCENCTNTTDCSCHCAEGR